jgi:hypothetical protein
MKKINDLEKELKTIKKANTELGVKVPKNDASLSVSLNIDKK